ncbi:MAG: IclR family transcriptional regulator [Burkholderiaceae bacterium]
MAERKRHAQKVAKPSKPGQGAESRLYVQSVEKAMKVLMAFDGTRRHLSLTNIAALADIDLSTAQRFTHTLTALGYLRKDPETREYELSVRLLDFTYHYLASSELVQRAVPVLHQLARDTEEACNLTVADGTDIVFVARLISRRSLNPNVIVGTRLPAYCTAAGLAILSTYEEHEVDDVLAGSELVQYTVNTVVDPKRIKERLSRIRMAGYSLTADELYYDDVSTAAPILDARGRAVGALNIAVSRASWDADASEKRYAALLKSAAASISAPRLPRRTPLRS